MMAHGLRATLLMGLTTLAVAADLLTLRVNAHDGVFMPASLTVPAGRRVKILIFNQGKSPIELENLQLRVEKVLGPQSDSFVVLNPLQPGSYHFVDDFHRDTGKLELLAR